MDQDSEELRQQVPIQHLTTQGPRRVSWPTEPTSESLQPWEVRNKPLEEQLPLQKNLVPRRSIPSPGLRASDFASPSSYRPPPRPSRPQHNFWELKLLSIRFPHLMPSEAACFTGQYRVLLHQ
uniref:uncharacterized protein C3orf22 homolog isoform X2 n=1 Tax=Jaculus jaculus TaxID=51337 RepID=UPI001E1B4EC7|nr:uncharacterized protein C3orf22 homolog isoform X2 [Jaculus jaculus]